MLALVVAVALAGADAGTSSLRIRAAGDVMLGTAEPEGFLPPEDGVHSLDEVKGLLADADLTFVNLEGPLCDDGQSSKCKKPGSRTCYAFRCPTRYGAFLEEAGVDLASTANNHSGDFGESCRRQTEATLDARHIAWSGPPGSIGFVEKNGLKVALVAFHTSGSCNDVNDLAAAKALVAKAKSQADLVVVSFHGGAEGTNATHVVKGIDRFLGENRGDLVPFAHGVIDAGADLVLGHGPHVVRALERYKEHLIIYSMGNFATYGRFDLSGPLAIGAVMEVEIARDGRFMRGHIFPTVQVEKGIPHRDEKNRAIGMFQKLTAEDFPKAGLSIQESGELTPAP